LKAPFLSRTADEEAPLPEGIRHELKEFIDKHPTEVYSSIEDVPTRFKDLTVKKGDALKTDFLVPKNLSGSAFTGGLVNQNNYDVFKESYGTLPGVYKLTGGHQSYGFALRIADLNEDVLQTLHLLDEYPSLDDDKLSLKEKHEVEDAWFSWAHYDFQIALGRQFPDREEEIATMPEPKILALFGVLKERVGAEWVFESGGNAYIEVNRLAEAATDEDLGFTQTEKTANVPDVIPVLYHGTLPEYAEMLLKSGFTPRQVSSGGNQGQGRYLYLTNLVENAMWFANEKGSDTVIEVRDIPYALLQVDPEDGIYETVALELSMRNGLPGNVVLVKRLNQSHFHRLVSSAEEDAE
jgi:hypothetical protein